MAEYLVGQLLAQGHEEDGPINGVETENVLADEMHISRPELRVFLVCSLPSRLIAQEGDVVGQSIQPHIDHMARVKLHWDAPAEGGAGHAQILKAGLEEIVDHLIFRGIPAG